METAHVQQENHLQRDGTPNPLSAKGDPFGQSCAMLTRERQQVGCSRKDATRFVCCMNARGVFVGSDQMTCENGWGCLKYLEVICPHFESVLDQIYPVKLSNKLRQPLQSKRTPFRAWKKIILASSLRTEHGYSSMLHAHGLRNSTNFLRVELWQWWRDGLLICQTAVSKSYQNSANSCYSMLLAVNSRLGMS